MSFQRLAIPSALDGQLRYQTGRLGLPANLLLRLGFCLSLAEPGLPDLALYEPQRTDGEAEAAATRIINRWTLFGQYELFFLALLRQRLVQDGLDPRAEELVDAQCKAHFLRGIGLVAVRVKDLVDLTDLVRQLPESELTGL